MLKDEADKDHGTNPAVWQDQGFAERQAGRRGFGQPHKNRVTTGDKGW